MPNANLYFKFRDSTTKAGATGLTVTANVFKLTKSGTKTTVASAASCAEVGGGLYAYNLSSPDFATYDYVATAVPSSTTGLDNADSDALWVDFAPDVQAHIPTNFALLGINTSGDILRVTLTDTATSAGSLTDADSVSEAVWGRSVRALTDKANFTLTNDYDSAMTAAQASTALSNVVWTNAKAAFLDAAISGVSGGGGLTQADVRAALGMAAADLDDQLAGIAAKTSLLPSSPAATGDQMTLTEAYDPAKTAVQVSNLNDLRADTLAQMPAAIGLAAPNLDTQLAAIAAGGVPPETAALLAAADQVLLVELYEESDVPEVIIPAAESSDLTNAYVTTFNGDGNLQAHVILTFQLTATPTSGSYTQKPFQRASSTSGQLVVALKKSTAYKAKRGDGAWVEFTTGSASSYALPAILGQ